MAGPIDFLVTRRSVLTDVGLALLVLATAGLLALHVGGPGEPVAGAPWVRAVYVLGLGLAVLLRRRRPLEATAIFWGAVSLQAITTGISNEGLHLVAGMGLITYASGRYGDRRSSLLGIGIHLAGYAAYTWWNADFQAGADGDLWAIAFFGVYVAVLWLLGWAVRTHHERADAARATADQAAATAAAVSAERSRIARELHDVVSHQLSVVVVQAAGARAQHPDAGELSALEKIENSGREALVEMRRMLDVLRDDEHGDDLEPVPDLEQLRNLVGTVRSTGVAVDLVIADDVEPLPPGVSLTVFRIVQESLTNTLKHSGGGAARVRVERQGAELVVEVVDDGLPTEAGTGGHGLVGMRERVSLLGGTLTAGPREGGGFGVRGLIPVDGRAR